MQDLRAADISPLERLPCRHLLRDMPILLDGTVLPCREDLHNLKEVLSKEKDIPERKLIPESSSFLVLRSSLNNVFTSSLDSIWNALTPLWNTECEGKHSGLCGVCDEYYTWNF
jgi:hypothetical protein